MISVASSLAPSTVNTPIDGRTVVQSVGDIANIELPYLGMVVYAVDTGKHYKITGLKAKQTGPFTTQNAAVDTYAELVPARQSSGSGGVSYAEAEDIAFMTTLIAGGR